MIYFQVLKAANVTRKAEQWLIVENERFRGLLADNQGKQATSEKKQLPPLKISYP
jgi:hypothetical protein